MYNSCLIVSGGEFSVPDIDLNSFDYIIACDKGYSYCEKLGITPDVIVGDFDSSEFPDTSIPVMKFPTRKDDTDTLLGIRHALDLDIKNLTIICALGRRLDHTFANIQSCVFAIVRSCKVSILSFDTSISFVRNEKVLYPRKDGWSFSCFSISDKCCGVSISGAKYNASDVEITNSFPIGVSNTWEEDNISIECTDGILMVIESKLYNGEHI